MSDAAVDRSAPDSPSRGVDAVRRHWAFQLAAAVTAAVISSVVTYRGATTTAKEEAGTVKDKAESGYQFTREALHELRASSKALQDKVAKLEAAVATLARYNRNQRLLASKRAKAEAEAVAAAAAVKAATPPPPPSSPLPGDLDKALVQQQQKASP